MGLFSQKNKQIGIENDKILYSEHRVVFEEVPDEISLTFLIDGCPLNCKGCHSKSFDNAKELGVDVFTSMLDAYDGYVSCVCFLGGEWKPKRLVELLDIAISKGFNTCLYTGLTEVHPEIEERLTYVKYGPYVESLGGLTSKTTNQKMFDRRTGEDITYKFWKV